MTPLTSTLLLLSRNGQLDDAVKIIRDAVESDKIPGAIVVARNGKILVEEIYGTSDLEKSPVPQRHHLPGRLHHQAHHRRGVHDAGRRRQGRRRRPD